MVLFADGAGCALIEPVQQGGLLSIVCNAQGQESMGAYIPAGGAQRPASADTVANGEHYLRVDPKANIFQQYVEFAVEISRQAMAKAGVGVKDIDHFITHQGNGPLVQLAAEALGFAPQQVVNEVMHHGNTAGASVAIVLDELRRAGRIQPGQKVLLNTVGAGVTFAAAVHQF